jgi:hypothetical protein
MTKKIGYYLLDLLINMAICLFFCTRSVPQNKQAHEQKLFSQNEDHLFFHFMKATQSLKSLWDSGENMHDPRISSWPCSKRPFDQKTDPSFLQCNPLYLQCLFAEERPLKIPFTVHQKTFHYSLQKSFPPISSLSSEKRVYKIIPKYQSDGGGLPPYGLLVYLQIEEFPGVRLPVMLDFSCRETFLPINTYAYGPMKKNITVPLQQFQPQSSLPSFDNDSFEDWIWDNSFQDIYIDRFLVTYNDLLHWPDLPLFQNQIPHLFMKAQAHLSAPATHIPEPVMKAFCQAQGMQILQAHVFDAATFLPRTLKKHSLGQSSQRGPYPWSKTLQKFVHDRLAPDCSLLFSSTCLEQKKISIHSSQDAGWIGISEILGGPLQYLPNPLHPKENLKASSWYFPADHPWQQLGMRSYWDKQGFNPENVDWNYMKRLYFNESPSLPPQSNSMDKLSIGFRCMRISDGEASL